MLICGIPLSQRLLLFLCLSSPHLLSLLSLLPLAPAPAPAAPVATDEEPLAGKVRESWYQSSGTVGLTLFAKGVPKESVKINYEEKEVLEGALMGRDGLCVCACLAL